MIVSTKYGRIEGILEDGVYKFKGIPYGAVPGRFREAVDAEAWEEVRSAKEYGAMCPQIGKLLGFKEKLPESEDCLFLNVYTNDVSGKAPVFFFIHGGAFIIGAGSTYDGTFFAENGIVCVTINYRMGAFGSFNFSHLDEGFASNIVLKDQARALKWVYENIEAFGGDPENITVAGESAGAISVLGLINAPSLYPYINKALIMSVFPEMFTDKESSKESAVKFMDKTGIKSKEELLSLSTKELNKKAASFFTDSDRVWGMMDVKLVVDGEFLANYPFDGAKKGEDAPIPIFFGTMDKEADFLFKAPIIKRIVNKEIDYRVEHYAGIAKVIDGDESYKSNHGKLGTDTLVKAPTEAYAYAHGQRHKTWLYRFCYAPRALRVIRVGAVHGLDTIFLFNGFKSPIARPLFVMTPNKKYAFSVASRYQSDILQFIKSGECQFDTYSKNFSVKCYGIKNRGQTDEVETSDIEKKQAWFEYFGISEKSDG